MGRMISWANEKGLDYAGFVVYLLLVIFTPYLKFAGRENFEATFAVTALFILLLPLFIKRYRNSDNVYVNYLLGIMVMIFIFDSISILNFIRVKGMNNIIANVIPNIKVALYILLVIAFYSLKYDRARHNTLVLIVLPSLALLVSFVGLFQHFDIFKFNDWFTRYFVSTESGMAQIEMLKGNQQWSRVLGTLSNPNFYSLQILIFLSVIISNVVYSRELMQRSLYLLAGAIVFMSLIYTQSRTGLLAFVGIIFYLMLIQIIKGGRRNVLKYLLILAGIIVLLLLLIKFMNLYYLFEIIRWKGDVNSVNHRLVRWAEAINLFKMHPLVGIGPVIGEYFPSVDNEYIHILRNYGLFGLVSHLLFYVFIFVSTLKDVLSRYQSNITKQFALAANLSVLAVLITNMTMATFYLWRNLILLLFICCMWAKSKGDNRQGSFNGC